MVDRHYTRRRFIGRTAASGVAVTGLGSILAACGGADSPAGQGAGAAPRQSKLKGPLASQQAISSGIVFQEIEAGVLEVARQLGIPGKKYIYDADNDRALAQLDQMATQQVKAVGTLILDNGITRQIAEACVRSNVYLSTWAQVGLWIVPCEEGVDFHYQCLANPPEGAYVSCKNMFKQLGGKGTFAHLQGAAGSATSRAKDKAIDRALQEFPGVKMVARQRGNYDRDTSRRVLDNIITANSGKLDAVFCQNDDSALGALSTLRERGLAGKTLLSGADGLPEMLDAIIAGEAFGTEGVVPFFGGGYVSVQALDAANGHKPDPVEGLMQMDMVMVDTPESAKVYKDLVYSEANGPKIFDYTKMSRLLHPDDWDPQWPLKTFEPEQFWAKNQGVPKPNGYELPKAYTDAAASGGREKIDALYRERLNSFPIRKAADASRTGKTLFEQLEA